MRVTKPRVAIIEALLKRESPVSIEQLHQELNERSCDLVTVYRCLSAFEEIGLVRRSFHHNGTSLFEFAHGGRQRSYHILCKSCGKSEPVDYFSVDGLERVLKERGYTQLTHLVEFFGICPTCQAARPQRDNAVRILDPHL
jgi:Fur family ferric uptake transcriptional regulator